MFNTQFDYLINDYMVYCRSRQYSKRQEEQIVPLPLFSILFLLQIAKQVKNIFVCRLPEFLIIDGAVMMGKNIPHTHDRAPRNGLVFAG